MKPLREARDAGKTRIGPSLPALSTSNANFANTINETRCRTENSFRQENRRVNTDWLKNQYFSTGCYIRNSMHTPPTREEVFDCMAALFDLLREEEHAAVRTVMGHWLFGYIHPYMDGNGRIGRFLLNVMLASGGYPWTVITIDRRDDYMAALEEASVKNNIKPLAEFLASLLL